jgi:hypothetical protein
MKPQRWSVFQLALAVCALLSALSVRADIVLTLPNDFIEDHKHRATITTDFEIHFAHSTPKKPSPSKPSNDGDIHISGVAAELPMPAVAELMNAASQPKALAFANKMKGTGEPVRITGVWRFWPEHGGDDRFFPGMSIEISDTNPDHVFEIHPTTEIGAIQTRTSFFPIRAIDRSKRPTPSNATGSSRKGPNSARYRGSLLDPARQWSVRVVAAS